MNRRVRAFAVCLLQSDIWHTVLYSLQEDKYYVEMLCTNSYGHNKEPCWPLYIITLNYQNMNQRLINNKGIVSVFGTFLKRLEMYITWILNFLMYLLIHQYINIPVLYEEAQLSLKLSIMKF